MIRIFAVLTTILLSFAGTAASATVINLTATLNGANEVAPVATPGTGLATMTFDTAANLLSWDLSWSGLLGTPFVIFFHGPADATQNAGVQINIGAISGLTSPSIGLTPISDLQETDLLAGLWYINIHTDTFPGGEIRGQVMVVTDGQGGSVPAPAALPLLIFGLGGLSLARRRRSRQD